MTAIEWPSFKDWQIGRAPTIEKKIVLYLRWKFIEFVILCRQIVPAINTAMAVAYERFGVAMKLAAQLMEESSDVPD